MTLRGPARLVLLIVLVLGVSSLVRMAQPDRGIYLFKGVKGPTMSTPIAPAAGARPSDFGGGSVNRLAILVTDTDSGWLGLARGLRAHGIPFSMTTSVTEAMRHKVVFAYPIISGSSLRHDDFDALRAHVAAGGSLLTFDVEGGGLSDIFGIAGAPTGTFENEMRWTDAKAASGDGVIRVSRAGTEAQLGVVAYKTAGARTLATFSSGKAALTCRTTVGTACALGVDLGALTARSMNGREEAVGRSYVNGYEPSVDVLYRWLAKFYVDGEPMPWLIDTAPAGKDVSVLLTHDIDFTHAVSSAATYAKALAATGTQATFFLQTKYVRDFNDDVFFNPFTVSSTISMLRSGMEVGSHSVAHSNAMKHFPLGDGSESYPTYRPFVKTRKVTDNASILGELRVSRYLLQRLTAANVTSFRAGYLSNPFKLPQALTASGYLYDSSITANSCLSHLPFQLTRDRADRSLEPVYEFPVTIEDESKPALISRLGAANRVIADIARSHGVAVILVHPDDSSEKLKFELGIVQAWRQRAWLTSLATFGAWWRARDDADIDVVRDDNHWSFRVRSGRPLHNLLVHLPKWSGTALRLPTGMTATSHQIVIDTAAPELSAAL